MFYGSIKNKNTLYLHILSLIYASYTEKGYYLEVISLLLRDKRVTTYGEKDYYLRRIHLFISGSAPISTLLRKISI